MTGRAAERLAVIYFRVQLLIARGAVSRHLFRLIEAEVDVEISLA